MTFYFLELKKATPSSWFCCYSTHRSTPRSADDLKEYHNIPAVVHGKCVLSARGTQQTTGGIPKGFVCSLLIAQVIYIYILSHAGAAKCPSQCV